MSSCEKWNVDEVRAYLSAHPAANLELTVDGKTALMEAALNLGQHGERYVACSKRGIATGGDVIKRR